MELVDEVSFAEYADVVKLAAAAAMLSAFRQVAAVVLLRPAAIAERQVVQASDIAHHFDLRLHDRVQYGQTGCDYCCFSQAVATESLAEQVIAVATENPAG